MTSEPITDRERFPLANPAAWRMLNRLRQHPHAPLYNYHCGEKLSAAGLAQVQQFAERLHDAPCRWVPGKLPDWLLEYVRTCQRDVPFYRDRDAAWKFSPTAIEDFSLLPLISREDLHREPWSFVPDSADLDDLIVYSTSGTTGNLIKVICDPTVPASYLPLIEYAAAMHGARIEGGNRVSIVQVAAQHSTYTLASVMSYFDFAGFAKVNLEPGQWRAPGDCLAFLEDCDAEIYTGDPFALSELAKLELTGRPKAIISSATTLLPAARDQLRQRFGCPVIDMVSMNESGPIAFSVNEAYQLFPHRLYVEILDDRGQPAQEGALGEIVLTGGINPMLPLLRYRTGDYGALQFVDGRPALGPYCGRTPVHFVRQDGSIVRSIDVVVALYSVPLPLFLLHQDSAGRLHFQTRCDKDVERDARERLLSLFGSDCELEMQQVPPEVAWKGKAIQFSSDMKPSV